MVKADSKEIVGLAGQTIHYRALAKKRAKKESSAAKLRRKRESEVWGKVINDIGPPPLDAEYVHVFDRGADNYEVFHHLTRQHCGWVVRASRLNRKVLTGPDGELATLNTYLKKLTVLGSYQLTLRARPQQHARTVQLEVRVGTIHVPVPRHCSPWVHKAKPLPIAMNVVYVVEVNPPAGIAAISWVLLTTLPITTFEDTWIVIEYYETRWLIEESKSITKP
jgi:hypothetical protein